MLAIFALGAVVATTASATEPPGFLFLSGTTAPVAFQGSSATAESKLVAGTDEISCTALELNGEFGKEANEAQHSILGVLTFDNTGCKEVSKKAKCSSENTKGEKDPAETILQLATSTDIHSVSTEDTTGKLASGWLTGILSVGILPSLKINCGLVKVEVLGSVFLEVKAVTEGADVESAEVQPNDSAKCDKNDKLCETELLKWDVAGSLSGLGAVLTKEEVNATFTANPVKVKFSKDVLIDF
jgi:hypothetical protein